MSRVFWPLIITAVLGAISLPIPVSGNAGPVTPLPPVTKTDGWAGTCFSAYPDPATGQGRPFIPLVMNAGSRWDRLGFVWPELEPRDGQWTFAAQDAIVSDLRTAGMNILGILLWTPPWAASSGVQSLAAPGWDQRPPRWYAPTPLPSVMPMDANPGAVPPRGLYEEWDDWTTADGDPINYWGRFVYTVVLHYRDSVKHWEVWNEEDYHWFWSGTSTDYARLLKVAYLATKAACPDCTVLFGGLQYYEKPNFYRWVLNTLKNDPEAPAYNYFFDAMAVHLYSRSSSIYDVVLTVRSGMREFVPDHPIWLTEAGVPVWDDGTVDPNPTPYIWSATQEEAASFVIQSYANARAAGVGRYFFFRAHDDAAGMGEYFGLSRDNLTLRPSYVAYQVATTYLVSPTMVTSVNYSGGVRRVTFWGTPWGKISVLWNTVSTPTVFSYPAILPAATLVDQRGITRTITPSGTSYFISLPGATANNGLSPSDYIIGGEPYLVIEADTVPPTTTIHVESSSTPTLTVAWEGADDAAGIWMYDVQVQESITGTWANWLTSATTVSGTYTASRPGAWCFRARAWDRAGNRGDWSAVACPTREVRLMVSEVYGDENGNGVRDWGEPAITATLRLLDGKGVDVISPTVGSSWEFTTTLPIGLYTLAVIPEGWPSPPPGWMPRWIPVGVEFWPGVLDIPLSVGLLPHRVSVYLPLVQR